MDKPQSHYAVIMQYPGDGKLEENRVRFFSDLDTAAAWRDRQSEDWLKVFRVEPAAATVAPEIPDHVLDLIRDLTDEDDCSFDHHGGCQAHGYLHLAGRKCPHAEAKELLALARSDRDGGDQ